MSDPASPVPVPADAGLATDLAPPPPPAFPGEAATPENDRPTPPQRRRSWPLFALAGVFIAIISGNTLAVLLFRLLHINANNVPDWLLVLVGGVAMHGFAGLGILAMLLVAPAGTRLAELEFRPVPLRTLARTVIVFGGVMFAMNVVSELGALGLDWLDYRVPSDDKIDLLLYGSDSAWLVMAFLATVVAPIMEELVFRNVIYRSLRLAAPHWLALIVTSAMFAAIHLSLVQFLPLFLLAAVLQEARHRTGSLLTSIFLHSLFNSVTIAYVTWLRFSGNA